MNRKPNAYTPATEYTMADNTEHCWVSVTQIKTTKQVDCQIISHYRLEGWQSPATRCGVEIIMYCRLSHLWA